MPAILEVYSKPGFFRCFRDPIRVPRIEYRVSRIGQNYHRVPRIPENRVPRIREIGSLQVHTEYLTFSLKNLALNYTPYLQRIAELLKNSPAGLLNVNGQFGNCHAYTVFTRL